MLVPGVLALLPEYAGLEDPVAELRAACLGAIAWLESGPVTVLADPQGARVAKALLEACGGFEAQAPGRLRTSTSGGTAASYLVVGNGSACRSERAPGHLDERAAAYDDALRAGLASSDVNGLDLDLGRSLLASLDGIARLPEVLPDGTPAQIDYDDDPFGVQYWVMRWQA
ncbi:hypothetical protein GCM10023350_26120 [Nocardioides endophyticus]|uniref:Uncharacterized protein n=1 Tax=Nocardioides endophyticus TaxID=1353775 RepID=A0ABP8YV15_9ACTN